MKQKFSLRFPAWILVVFMSVYTECILHLTTNPTILPGRLAAVILFALGFGLALGLIVRMLPDKAGKWVAVVLGFLLCVMCLLQYFLKDAYQVFMNLASVVNNAAGVATGYTDVVVNLLLGSWWRILLVLLPVILYAIFGENRTRSGKWQRRGKRIFLVMALASALMYGLAVTTVHVVGIDAGCLGSAFSFDAGVRGFGANTAAILDIVRGSESGGDLAFEIPETVPTVAPTTQPETVPTESVETLPPETTEPPRVYGPHVYDLDFAQLAQEESNSTIASIHSYVASQTPAMENDYTGLFEGKNLILITAEAFSSQVIDPEISPTLYRMATEGIHFTDYYHPVSGCGTTGGEYGHVVGLSPAGGTISMMDAVEQNYFLTMGNQLQKLGYNSAAYHNNDHKYYDRDITHTHLGYDSFIGHGNGMEEHLTNVWTRSDEEMFQYTIPLHLDQQPFSLYYMTVSGHSAYSMSNAMCAKNFHLVEHLDASETLRCYLACNLELEHAMRYLIETLEAAGIADDTVVVITTDHFPYGLAASNTWGGEDYLHELYGTWQIDDFVQDSSALIIWSGCLEDMDIVVDDPVSVLDILPTLSNLFGVEYDSRLLPGRDVFSDTEPLVYWPVSYTWKTDKASYNGRTGVFKVAEGVEVGEEYKDQINAIVRNKMVYSRSVQQYNYFNVISELMGFEK